MRRSTERGQALPLLAILLVLAAALAVVVAELGSAAVQRARARTAADAAALAGAAATPSAAAAAARAVAEANGAELVAFTVDGAIVEVDVRHGRATARATAEATAPPASALAGASPALAAAFARAEQLLGRPVDVAGVSADGRTVEVSEMDSGPLAAAAGNAGLCRQAPPARPVHFRACPPTPPG